MNDRNIVITGFMGTGKSTVGKLVAEQLARPFLDTDDEIVRRAGKPIAEIFAQQGEAAFRQMEGRLCRFLAAQRGYVISTGGGMLVDAGNRQVMLSASALVVCLTATPDAIAERVSADTERPLLKGDWRALLEKRRSAYEAIPCQVDTSRRAPNAIAEDIIRLWQSSR
ncbi:MAG: shikimate kinase [Anaerolineae bacterium]|nr:shikimate kinase [Anaerolineae bacterium]